MRAILNVVLLILDLYTYVLIGAIVLSWLISLDIINRRNQFVYSIFYAFSVVTEPVLQRIRRFLPDMGALDLSPLVVFLLIYFIKDVIMRYVYPYVF